jgi:putative endonuclease
MTIFVEVKARSSDLYGGALAAVDAEKQRRIVRLAATYLSRHGLWERPCRFDVVILEGVRRGWPWRMCHVRDAFRPDLGRQL